MNTTTNSELRQKLIQLYEKGADSVLIDWERDDTKPLIEEIEALINNQIIEARIDELKKVGCCDYWEEGCSLNVCHGEQLKRIEELRTTK